MTTIKKTLKSFYLLRILSIVLFAVLAINFTYAQESTPEKNTAVTGVFNSGTFIENQTTVVLPKHTFEFVVNHRFGKIGDGFKELFGIYSPSNIRFALNYGITDKFQIGLGTTKYNKIQDLNYKYSIFEQTTNNKIPVSIVYFGSISYDAREEATSFSYENYSFSHRFSYFNEIMASRKFCDFFSMQVAATHTHLNIVESASEVKADPLYRNDQFGMSVLGKLNITPTLAFTFEYDKNFSLITKKVTDKFKEVKPNFSLGIENSTAAHSFQVFITTAEAIDYSRNMAYNQNTFTSKGLMIGFNITRVFY
ncbi:MAG: hypothetical protein HXX18_00255 [Bacteroidetes bacterium]|nr:hypothetical protein [Bacteroidota bacterium]